MQLPRQAWFSKAFHPLFSYSFLIPKKSNRTGIFKFYFHLTILFIFKMSLLHSNFKNCKQETKLNNLQKMTQQMAGPGFEPGQYDIKIHLSITTVAASLHRLDSFFCISHSSLRIILHQRKLCTHSHSTLLSLLLRHFLCISIYSPKHHMIITADQTMTIP